MRFTILDNTGPRVIPTTLALACVAALPLVVMSPLGDPFQAPRAVLATVAIAVLLVFGAADASLNRSARIAGWTLGGLGAWYLLAALVNQPGSSVWGVQGRLQGLMTFVILATAAIAGALLTRRAAPVLAAAMAVITAGVSAIVVVQAVIGTPVIATFGNSAIAGAWLAVGVGVSLGGARVHPRRQWRPAFYAIAALGTIAAGATGSRAAVVAVAVAGAVTLLSRRVSARNAAVGLLAAAVLVAGGITLAPEQAKFSAAALTTGSALSRAEIWRSTSALIAANPVTGVGPGRFLYEFPQYQTVAHATAEGPDVRPDQAHSLPLQFAAEGGAPAGAALVALGVLALLAGWRGARAGDGAAVIALIGLAAYVTQAAFGVAAIETDALGWLLAGVAVASNSGTRSVATSVTTLRWSSAAVALALVPAALWYCIANASYGQGLDLYAQADFVGSLRSLESAVQADPLTDVYRVGVADTASYMDETTRTSALASLDAGLVIEPHSYDLALARARMLSLLDRPPAEVEAAYQYALELYPLGVTVRAEAAAAREGVE